MDEVRLPRRERERLRHRQEILGAAQKLVLERGIAGVTVEEVAREADFAVGSIYRHFRSKEDLVRELVLGLIDGFLVDLDAIISADQPFPARLLATVSLFYRSQVERRDLLVALFEAPGPLVAPGSEGAEQLRAVRRRTHALVDRLIADGQAQGLLQPGERRPLVTALLGQTSAFSRAAMFGATPLKGDAPETIVRLYLGGAGA